MNKWFELTPFFLWLGMVIFIAGPIMGAWLEHLEGPVMGWVAFGMIELPAVLLTIHIITDTARQK
jgi:hypothetical protein